MLMTNRRQYPARARIFGRICAGQISGERMHEVSNRYRLQELFPIQEVAYIRAARVTARPK